MPIRTRKPTGKIPWPLILLAGEEKAGKSYTAAAFCSSQRVGDRYWIDLGEGAADEYVSLSLRDKKDEGYQIVDHNGTFRDILDQILAIEEEAVRADKAGEPPVVVVVDSGSAMWKALSTWATSRAARTRSNQAKIKDDPDADIDVGPLFWNSANRWHRQIIDALMRMPAIVIITARLAEKSVIGPGGRPTGEKEWKAEVQKDLPYDATAVIYVRREGRRFTLAGVRSLFIEHEAGEETELAEGSLDLEKFIWEGLRCSQEASGGRVMSALVVDAAEKYLDEIANESSEEALRALWAMAKDGLPPGEDRQRVSTAITARLEMLRSLPTGEQDDEHDPTVDATSAALRAAAADEKQEAKSA